MDSLIEIFHLDIKLLLAQIINFAIVFSVLYWFALKPIFKIMGERTKKIEKSLADAKEIEHRLAQTDEATKKLIIEAKKEASLVIEAASKKAEIKHQEVINKTKEEVGQIINQEKERIRLDKAEALKEIKAEMADLIEASLKKILGEDKNINIDKKIIDKLIK